MEERIKQISRCLKAVFTCYWLLAILMVVCGETLDSWTGLYAGDVRSTYQAETATILLAVGCCGFPYLLSDVKHQGSALCTDCPDRFPILYSRRKPLA